jgi:hypothetical protein
VRAICANSKKLVASAHQDDVFATCLTKGDRSVGKIANEQPLCQIAFLRFFPLCHTYATTAR